MRKPDFQKSLLDLYPEAGSDKLLAPPRFSPKKDDLIIGSEGLKAWEALIHKIHAKIFHAKYHFAAIDGLIK